MTVNIMIPALGIPAVPIDATVAVKTMRTISSKPRLIP